MVAKYLDANFSDISVECFIISDILLILILASIYWLFMQQLFLHTQLDVVKTQDYKFVIFLHNFVVDIILINQS